MKKQKIQFIVILIVLAVLIAATFGMKWYNKNKEEEKTAEEEASTIYISKVDVDTITAFSYEVDHVTYTFTKDGDTWKIGTGLETKIVSSIVAGSPKVLVSLYRYADSSDYNLVTNTIDLEGREIEITDSENTSFASWEQKASIGTFYYCSAYLNGLDQDYALLVNGESVTFAEEKG